MPNQEMAHDDATVRPMQPDELDEVFALVQAAFGPDWPRLPLAVPPLDHLKWKQASPLIVPDDARVVHLDGKIVGYVCPVRRNVWVRGDTVAGGSAGDFAIHPDYQGRHLTKTLFSSFDTWSGPGPVPIWLYEAPTHPKMRRSMERRGERVFLANQVDRLVLPLKMGGGAIWGPGRRASVRPALRATRNLARVAWNRLRWRRYSTPAPALTLRTVEQFDEQADALWAQARDVLDFAVVRDRTYLNWRYCDPRAGVYRVRASERHGDLTGFIVTALNGGDAQLVDVFTAPDDEDTLRALIEDTVIYLETEGAEALTVLLPRHHPYRRTFQRYGFIPGRASPLRFGKRDDTLLDFLADDPAARLHLALGDSDAI